MCLAVNFNRCTDMAYFSKCFSMDLGSKNVTQQWADVFESHPSTLRLWYLLLFDLSLIICRLTACQPALTIAHYDMVPIPITNLCASLPSYGRSIMVPALDFHLSSWSTLLEALHHLLRVRNMYCKASLLFFLQSSKAHFTIPNSTMTITFLI